MQLQEWFGPAAFFTFVALLYFAIGRLKRRLERPLKPVGPDETDKFMPLLSLEAVERGRTEFGIALDFSPQSVTAVEATLGRLHHRHAAGELDGRRVFREAMTWGAYIGEVSRRLYGGRWEQNSTVAGPESYPLHIRGGECYVVGWCGKRILNGDEDNVLHKFRIAILKDDDATYFPDVPFFPEQHGE